ncbi:cytochrome b [Caballeronia sordidicola]|uniref:cytochrome b n=1 Tax=Caballeronia sordidicola TaxID=196367 RepID=UPI002115DD18|nr:cytochrome b [Caballeronia sordidicola]
MKWIDAWILQAEPQNPARYYAFPKYLGASFRVQPDLSGHVNMRQNSSTTPSAYGRTARFFHSATVLLLASQFAIAWTMPDVHRGPQPVGLIAWHLSVGMLILLLVAVRIVWRFTHPAPRELPGIPRPLAAVARLTHWMLYLLLIALPLMGWANASSRGWPSFLGTLLPLPALSPEGSPFGHSLGDWHKIFAWVLLALVVMHAAAAVFHHFVLRDATLRRMFPTSRDSA